MTSTQARDPRQEERVRPIRWPLFFLFAFPLLLPGCRRCDLVETELRARERQLREMHDELDVATFHNDSMHRELEAWRQGLIGQQPAVGGPAVKESPGRQPGVRESISRPSVSETQPAPTPVPPPPITIPPGPAPRESRAPVLENFSVPNTVKEIALGRQTGGYDDDKVPGDDAVQVVVEPRDGDGHAIKVPGNLRVTALEILPQGSKKPISTWDVPADQLRRSWKSGLFGAGYYVVLPWKAWPCGEKLRIVAQFTLSDGRYFEADKDVSVRLPPEALRKPLGPVLPPDPDPLLPVPRRVEVPVSTEANKPVVPAFIYTGVQLAAPQPIAE